MKKIFSNNRVIAIALLTIFSVSYAPAALGNDGLKAIPVELKFLGTINNQLALQLVFSGDSEQNDFNISIRDTEGVVLYNENIKGESFSKKFLFNTDEIGDTVFLFEIKSKKTGKSVVFRVSRNSYQVDNMAIQELN